MSSENSYQMAWDLYWRAFGRWAEADLSVKEDRRRVIDYAIMNGDLDRDLRAEEKDDEFIAEEAMEALENSLAKDVLSVESKVVKTITLGTGGPAYGFEVTCSEDASEIENVSFWYQDWGMQKIYIPVDDRCASIVAWLLGMEV